MATVTKPIALDESLNTTEATPRNIADVLAEGIGDLIHAVSQIAPQTVYDLDDLGDVDITSPSNGQVLKYNGTSQKWENGTGGGSGGGHTIEDRDGVDLTQRANLQFVDGLKATDDAVNGATVVSDKPDEYTWAQWNNLTTAQQEAIPHALITDAPDVDAGVNADLLTKLWENPNPTSAFVGQNITLSSSDYDFLLVIHNSVAGQSYGNYSWIGKKSDTISCTYSAFAGTALYVASRRLSTNGASCSYTDNTYTGNGASITENLRNVPLAIYGIKKTLNLQFTAIASDVSTSADKCMLSDGVTSVEDVADGIDIKGSITPQTGVTIYTAKKYGNLIYISFITPKVTSANTLISLFTIDEASYRPPIIAIGNLGMATNSDIGYGSLSLSSSGACSVMFSKTTTYGLYGNFVYGV